MDNNEIGSRINHLIFNLGVNQSLFAKTIGFSQPSVNKIISGQTKPSYSLLEAICVSYPQVNKDWLIQGKGEMFQTTQSLPPSTGDNYLLEYLRRLEDKFEKLTEQLTVKDKQIDRLMDLLGKHECVTGTGVLKAHPATEVLAQRA